MMKEVKVMDAKTALLNATINRLAEAQEKANDLISKQLEYLSKSQELNAKQFQLNLDNHEYNREQAKITDERNQKTEAQNEEMIEIQKQLINNTKSYVDESIQAVMSVVNGHAKANNNYFEKIGNQLQNKADKVDDKQLAETISKNIFGRIKGRGIVKR